MKTLNVGLIGTGFMGRTHSNAYQQAVRFFGLEVKPVPAVVCSPFSQSLPEFASRWGWQEGMDDWHALIRRPDIDVIDICTPNHTHSEIALEALAQGKIVICEKPLALNAAEAQRMAEAAHAAGVPTMVSFNYRRVPAVTLAHQLIEEGRLGRIFHYRAQYLQDWTMSPKLGQGGDTLWRLDAASAGSGVTGDLLAHSIDLALWLAGPISEVTAMTETFIRERPLQDDPSVMKPVHIDDACAFLARFAGGALGTFESTRYARGRKNYNTFEINGEKGTITFDFENAHQLRYYDHGDSSLVRGFHTIGVWDSDHPYMSNYWVPGCAIGYEHTFVNEIADFFGGLAAGEKRVPDFEDGYRVQLVCDAVLESAASGMWMEIAP